MRKTVPQELYTEDFFLNTSDGAEEFVEGELSERLHYSFSLANVKKGMRILDVGTGRGDLAVRSAKAGAFVEAIDYSPVAIRITRENIKRLDKKTAKRIRVSKMNIKKTSFSGGCFDLIFMIDVVEHLYPKELERAFLEIKRILKPGGRIIIHTPNNWLIKPLYLLARIFFPWWKRHKLHVNEQSFFDLYQKLKLFQGKRKLFFTPRKGYFYNAVSGFKKTPLWVVLTARLIDNVLGNKIVSFLIYHSPLVFFLGTDLWAIVEIPTEGCKIRG